MRPTKIFFACCAAATLACCTGNVACAQTDHPELFEQAVHCLYTKQFLQPERTARLTFGFFLDEESNPGKKMLYVIEFPNPQGTDGYVFTIFVTQSEGRRNLDIQNNGRFKLSKSGDHGVEFVDPPLGGTWTQEQLISAIRRIERQPKTTIAANSWSMTDSSITCKAYTDPQPAPH